VARSPRGRAGVLLVRLFLFFFFFFFFFFSFCVRARRLFFLKNWITFCSLSLSLSLSVCGTSFREEEIETARAIEEMNTLSLFVRFDFVKQRRRDSRKLTYFLRALLFNFSGTR